jgi:hypothetical protein
MLPQGDEQAGWQGRWQHRGATGNFFVVLQAQAAVKMKKLVTGVPGLLPGMFVYPPAVHQAGFPSRLPDGR